jgi:nucleoside-diphosphate-sugar epimerase
MKVLITGGAGFLGRGMVAAFDAKHPLRLMDLCPWGSSHEVVAGDVADLDQVRHATEGVDGIVIAHMAGRPGGGPLDYDSPPTAFDANVKGTANLLFAAAERNIRRVVLISSAGGVGAYTEEGFRSHDHPPKSKSLYGLTKVLQEIVAEHFSRVHGIGVAVLRVGYIVDADALNDKYDRKVRQYGRGLIDRRDIGEAARLALELPDLEYETFFVFGTKAAEEHFDVEHTRRRLGWTPRFDFSSLVEAEGAP